MNRRLFFIAGEASGDVYGAYLIQLLKQQYPLLEINAIGGDKMKLAGANLIHHIRELSVMGFVEVVKNFSRIKKIFRSAQSNILEHETDTLILIDFPGFNLRMAAWAKARGIRTIQYISPKVWAWKESRIAKIKQHIDTLICVFPFEIEYFKQFDIAAHYFGNPLFTIIQSHQAGEASITSGKQIIGLMPGSRQQEIKRILPVLVKFASEHDNYEFIIGGMSLIGEAYYKKRIKNNQNISVLMDRNYDILQSCQAVINTSGTITLESLLFEKPQVVVYAMHPVSYAIISRLIKLKYISLPNILANKAIVPELIQDKLTIRQLHEKLKYVQSQNFRSSYRQIGVQLQPRNEDKLIALIMGV